MGRKRTLTAEQVAKIEQRIVNGESRRELAKEYGVSEAAIRRAVSTRIDEIKYVANQIVDTERRLSSLPISSQIVAQNLAAKLRAISDNLLGAAHYSAMTAHRLTGIAHQQLDKIDDADPGQSIDTLKSIAGLQKIANEASQIPINLLRANKENEQPEDKKPQDMTDDEILARLEELRTSTSR